MKRFVCTVYFCGDDWSPGVTVAFDAEDEDEADEEAREWANAHWPEQEVDSVRVEEIEE